MSEESNLNGGASDGPARSERGRGPGARCSSVYPKKTLRKRGKQMLVNEDLRQLPAEIGANVRTIPGIITQRGCTYAGCKGVVLGPTRDIINLTHGPDRLQLLRLALPPEPDRIRADGENYMTYSLLHRHAGRQHRLRR
jgi:hypothetical protein